MLAQPINLTADLFFASALRAGADGALTRLLPLADLKEPLAPHERFAQRVLLALQGLGYIEPELSLSWAADWLYSRDWLSHGFESVSWRILRPARPVIEVLQTWQAGIDATPAMLETCTMVWEDLALAEVMAYARWSLAQTGFNPCWAEDATDALVTGLKIFSADQLMYLVYVALRSLTLAHQRGTTRRDKPGYVFALSIFTYVKRAQLEQWTIRGMTRTPELPRSAITVLFADLVTGLGDRYYSERPCQESLVAARAERVLG